MKTTFYTAEHIASVRRKNRIWNLVFTLVCLTGLGLCVFFCVNTNVLNAQRMEWYAIGTFTLTGWIGITLVSAVLRYNRALILHEERILAAGGSRVLRGRLQLEKRSVQIPGGLSVRRVSLDAPEGQTRVHVAEVFAKQLTPFAGKELGLLVSQGFVTGVEP